MHFSRLLVISLSLRKRSRQMSGSRFVERRAARGHGCDPFVYFSQLPIFSVHQVSFPQTDHHEEAPPQKFAEKSLTPLQGCQFQSPV